MSSAEPRNKRPRAQRSPIDAVGVDELALALSFLGWKEIVRSRVCHKFKEAAAAAFRGERAVVCDVKTVSDYQSLPMMVRTFPDLSKMHIHGNNRLRFRDGDDPVRGPDAREVPPGTHQLDFNVLSAFSNMRRLYLSGIDANGRYPRLLSSLRGLRVLFMLHNGKMKLDLSDFQHCQQMTHLYLSSNLFGEDHLVTGDIGILSGMQNLESVTILNCPSVTGDVMQLARSSLTSLSLSRTGVTVNFDSIGSSDFVKLKTLSVTGSVTIASVDEARSAVASVHRLEKRGIRVIGASISLRKDSPDRYPMNVAQSINIMDWIHPPHDIEIVRAGPRVGWRWCGIREHSNCAINWLDNAPAQSSEEHSKYVSDLATLEETPGPFNWFHDHPTEEEYNEAVERHRRFIALC